MPSTQEREKDQADTDARLTVRIEPDLNEWLAKAADYLLIDKSKLVRLSLLEYVDRHPEALSPRLIAEFKAWRRSRGRQDGL